MEGYKDGCMDGIFLSNTSMLESINPSVDGSLGGTNSICCVTEQ